MVILDILDTLADMKVANVAKATTVCGVAM